MTFTRENVQVVKQKLNRTSSIKKFAEAQRDQSYIVISYLIKLI